MSNEQHDTMRRDLKNRHIQMIALGGAIGTGLFYGSADAITTSGPSVLFTYALVGLIIFLVMRQMSEMLVDEPVSGSFSHFAYKYWGKFPGFFSGWNYWLSYVIVNMIELTVIGKYINFWFPDIPYWQSAMVLFFLITAANLVQVALFGELEFWFSIIKVATIVLFMLLGLGLIFSGNAGPDAAISNLWALEGGFMPKGLEGMLLSLTVIIFAYGGTELLGVAAGEAQNPEKTIPKATNQVMWRIMLFYIGALTVVMVLNPWTVITNKGSPFVQVFSNVGIHSAAHLVNFVVITAILSAYNSGLYSNARMLFSLAEHGNAPACFGKLNSKGVPINGILFSSALTGCIVFFQYLVPMEKLFELVIEFSVACDTINRIMIIITHMKFKKEKARLGQSTAFPAPGGIAMSWVTLAFMVFVFVLMLFFGIRNFSADQSKYLGIAPLVLAPVWVVVMYVFFKMKKSENVPAV